MTADEVTTAAELDALQRYVFDDPDVDPEDEFVRLADVRALPAPHPAPQVDEAGAGLEDAMQAYFDIRSLPRNAWTPSIEDAFRHAWAAGSAHWKRLANEAGGLVEGYLPAMREVEAERDEARAALAVAARGDAASAAPTRTEWGVRTSQDDDGDAIGMTRADAERVVRYRDSITALAGAVLVRREVTDWQEVRDV